MGGNANSGRRPGRPPMPTALKLLRGNPGKRRLNDDEPVLTAADETFDIPPTELNDNDRARAEWSRLAPLMRACGLVSQAERSALIALCIEWSAYLAAQDELKQARLLPKGKNGKYRLSPAIAIADRALSNCHRLWSELGLTPSGRARVARLPNGNTGRLAPTATPPSKWQGII